MTKWSEEPSLGLQHRRKKLVEVVCSCVLEPGRQRQRQRLEEPWSLLTSPRRMGEFGVQ